MTSHLIETVATSNDETVITPLPRPPSDNPPQPPPVVKKAPFPSASKWGRLVSSSLAGGGTGTGNTQPTTPAEKSVAKTATEPSPKTSEGGGAVGAATKQSRWGRLKATASDPPRASPTHTKLSKTVSEVGAGASDSQKRPLDAPRPSLGGVTVHVTKAELNANPGADPVVGLTDNASRLSQWRESAKPITRIGLTDGKSRFT